MKAGQILSMVDDRAVGSGGFWPYQKALSRLQADAPPMHPTLVHKVLQDELGLAVRHFPEFSEEPMAAASVGQVHRAVLSDRREVVVKIQYPGVAQAIRDDLANTELLATFMRFVTAASGIKVDIRALAREAAARIAEEIDYRHEAATITAFSELYRGHPFIHIPEVIPEASSDRVLTMTYLDGVDYPVAQQADQDLKNTWAEVITRFINANYRHTNLVHADPHPGNYRFKTDGSVGFLDFGERFGTGGLHIPHRQAAHERRDHQRLQSVGFRHVLTEQPRRERGGGAAQLRPLQRDRPSGGFDRHRPIPVA